MHQYLDLGHVTKHCWKVRWINLLNAGDNRWQPWRTNNNENTTHSLHNMTCYNMLRYLPVKRIYHLLLVRKFQSISFYTYISHKSNVPCQVHLCESQDYLGPASAFQLHFSDPIHGPDRQFPISPWNVKTHCGFVPTLCWKNHQHLLSNAKSPGMVLDSNVITKSFQCLWPLKEMLLRKRQGVHRDWNLHKLLRITITCQSTTMHVWNQYWHKFTCSIWKKS